MLFVPPVSLPSNRFKSQKILSMLLPVCCLLARQVLAILLQVAPLGTWLRLRTRRQMEWTRNSRSKLKRRQHPQQRRQRQRHPHRRRWQRRRLHLKADRWARLFMDKVCSLARCKQARWQYRNRWACSRCSSATGSSRHCSSNRCTHSTQVSRMALAAAVQGGSRAEVQAATKATLGEGEEGGTGPTSGENAEGKEEGGRVRGRCIETAKSSSSERMER